MGAIKSAYNIVSFGFSLLFVASIADIFINPGKMAPFALSDLSTAFDKAEREAASHHKKRRTPNPADAAFDGSHCLFDARIGKFVGC